MARRRRVGSAVPAEDVRGVLVERCRRRRERARRLGRPDVSSRLEALEAGEPVELDGWEVPWPQPFGSWDRLRLERDGSLTVVPFEERRPRLGIVLADPVEAAGPAPIDEDDVEGDPWRG